METVTDVTDTAVAEAAEAEALEALNRARVAEAYEMLEAPEAAWAREVLEKLEGLADSDILSDVDITIYDGDLEAEEWGELRPGTIPLFTILTLDPNRLNRVHLWSRRSAQHAQAIADTFGLTERGLVTSCYRKPYYIERYDEEAQEDKIILCGPNDLTMEITEEIVGFTPDAAIDNDPEDFIIDAPDGTNIKVPDFRAQNREPAVAA